jgi:hypothetical protein
VSGDEGDCADDGEGGGGTADRFVERKVYARDG